MNFSRSVSWRVSLALVGFAIGLVASAAQSDRASAPPTPTSCTESAADRTRLHRETERLRRMPRVRNWLRADALLDEIGTVCDLAVRSCTRCAGELATRARSLHPVCQEATRPVWTAIGLEEDLREGRRELRRLTVEEEGQQYGELVGQYEHQQQEALRQHPQMMLRLDAQIAALEQARAAVHFADRAQTELASVGLRTVQARLGELTTHIAVALDPRLANPPRRR